MSKLYYTPTSCGAANFLAARISGVTLPCEQVDLKSHITSSGLNFYEINPKGNVPTIITPHGSILNENNATLTFIADLDPAHTLLPPLGNEQRYDVANMLSYVATEYHQSVSHLFNPSITDDVCKYFVDRVNLKLTYLNDHVLKGKTFLVGSKLSIADLYLYICLTWSPYINIDISLYPHVFSYFEGIKNIDAVKEGHAAMATDPATTN